MGQAIVTVLVLIIVVIYAVLFAFWNQEVVDVVTLQMRALASVQAELSAVKQQSNERAKKVNRLIEQVKQLKADLAETSGQEAPDDSDLEPT